MCVCVCLGSRDSSMALWSVPTHGPHEDCPEKWFPQEQFPPQDQFCLQNQSLSQIQSTPQDQLSPQEDAPTLAECVPVMKPIFHFSNSCSEPYALTSVGDRVRSLAYNEHKYELASLQASSDSNSSVHFWDVILFEKVRLASTERKREGEGRDGKVREGMCVE